MLRLLLYVPFAMAATMLMAPVLIRVGVVTPLGGFGAAMGAWVVGASAGLLGGLVGFLKPETRPLAWAALGLGALLACGLALTLTRNSSPPIHDITNNLDDPPAFTVATQHPDNAGRDMSYPHGDPRTPDLQREHYPHLSTPLVICDGLRSGNWDVVVAAAQSYDWNVTWMNAEAGLIEAEATTGIFRFVDDIVIRVSQLNPPDGCVTISMRSTSRVGRSDLGVNARRISDFLEAAEEQITAEWKASMGAS
jgi:hypothetical protein